jgi:uncharacterized protein YqhQ
MIGGQALIEGIMMRGPEKDAIVVRTSEGLDIDIAPRKTQPKNSILSWPFIRGPVNFFDAQVTGVKALMRSADLNPEAAADTDSKFDKWLEKKLSDKKNQETVMTIMVCISLLFSVGLFFVLPMLLGSLFEGIVSSTLGLNLIEGLIRVVILVGYMLLASLPKDMQRVFAYHGAEHKTICCYEEGLPLTIENVRKQCRFHPRCGTSFLLIVVLLSVLLFSLVSTGLYSLIPALAAIRGTIGCRLIMILVKLLLLPVIVAIAYEINRLVGRYDNWFTKFLTAPGLWMQRITTKEPDDEMIEVGITAVQAVLPTEEGADRW